jgi:hypothetical protein
MSAASLAVSFVALLSNRVDDFHAAHLEREEHQ